MNPFVLWAKFNCLYFSRLLGPYIAGKWKINILNSTIGWILLNPFITKCSFDNWNQFQFFSYSFLFTIILRNNSFLVFKRLFGTAYPWFVWITNQPNQLSNSFISHTIYLHLAPSPLPRTDGTATWSASPSATSACPTALPSPSRSPTRSCRCACSSPTPARQPARPESTRCAACRSLPATRWWWRPWPAPALGRHRSRFSSRPRMEVRV